MHVIGSWDGESTELQEGGAAKAIGKDEWYLQSDGHDVFRTTFSNHPIGHEAYAQRSKQEYGGPLALPGAHPAMTGIAKRGELGYFFNYKYTGERGADATYHIEIAFPHTLNTAELRFGGNLSSGKADESWGLGAVQVQYRNFEVPPRPQNLSASLNNEGDAQLEWDSDDDLFQLQRRAGAGSKWELIAIQNYPRYSDLALEPAVEYSYRVRAFNPAGHSRWSNQFAAVHHVVSISGEETTFQGEPYTISLDKGTAAAVDSWEIRWNDGTRQEKLPGSATTATHVFEKGRRHDIRVFARIGNALYEANQQRVYVIPTSTTELSVKAKSGRKAILAWTDKSNWGKYVIERSPDGVLWQQVGTIFGPWRRTFDRGLKENTQYFYRVRLATANFLSPNFSNVVEVRTFVHRPSNFEEESSSQGMVRVRWKDESKFETGYLIEYALGWWGMLEFETLAQTDADVSFLDITGLEPRKQYMLRISAIGNDQPSVYSWVRLPILTPDAD